MTVITVLYPQPDEGTHSGSISRAELSPTDDWKTRFVVTFETEQDGEIREIELHHSFDVRADSKFGEFLSGLDQLPPARQQFDTEALVGLPVVFVVEQPKGFKKVVAASPAVGVTS